MHKAILGTVVIVTVIAVLHLTAAVVVIINIPIAATLGVASADVMLRSAKALAVVPVVLSAALVIILLATILLETMFSKKEPTL